MSRVKSLADARWARTVKDGRGYEAEHFPARCYRSTDYDCVVLVFETETEIHEQFLSDDEAREFAASLLKAARKP